MAYDRSRIMRHAHQIRRDRGIPLGDAIRAAWAHAREERYASLPSSGRPPCRTDVPAQQPGGLAAGLARYGLTGATAARLSEAAAAALVSIYREAGKIVALIRVPQAPALPAPGTHDARRRADGTWEI